MYLHCGCFIVYINSILIELLLLQYKMSLINVVSNTQVVSRLVLFT